MVIRVLFLLLVAVGCGSPAKPAADASHGNLDAAAQVRHRQGTVLSNRGALFLQQQSPRRALNTLERAIELAPQLPDAHFNLGLVHARLGHHAEATASFERAAGLGFARPGLDIAYGVSLCAQNRYAQASAVFARAVQASPGRADLRLYRGEVLRAMGSLDSALSVFDEAVRLDSTLGAAHRYRGELLAAADRQVQAAAAYAHAVRVDTDDVAALVGQAEALRRLGRLDEATAALQSALLRAPRLSRAHYILARVAKAAGQREQARRARQDFQRLTQAQRHFDQAQVYARRGRFDDADGELTRAVEVDPAFAAAWLRLGALRLQRRRPADALESLGQVARRWPDYPEASNLTGEAYLQLGEHDRAAAAFAATLESNPSSVAALVGIGRAHFARSRFEDAQTAFRRALDLNPDEGEGYFFLGLVYAHRGLIAEAVTSLEQCLAVHPDYVEAHYHLGRILSGKGDLGTARQHLQRVLALDPEHARAADRLASLDKP